MKTVLIAAGGTGGHIFPALAVARRLQSEGLSVHWVGSSRSLEQRLVKPYFNLTCMRIESVRGRGHFAWLSLPWRLFRAVVQALGIVRRVCPDVVVTFGSFVSAPVGLAAWVLKKPLVVHEQNAIAGMTNRYLARIATYVVEAFSGSFPPTIKTYVLGNPVRQELSAVLPPAERFLARQGPLRLLVLGGSQGARAINASVLAWVKQYALADEVMIWHQTGETEKREVASVYESQDVQARVDDFIDDMASAYVWADLVICRSGALTVSELMTVGLASILVPFPHAVDDHQYKNAQFLARADAAQVVRESDLSSSVLQQLISPYISNLRSPDYTPIVLQRAQKAYELQPTSVVGNIVMLLKQISEQSRGEDFHVSGR
jgi:UDP-N-acetylglucosamine--N-acetylmuramyl-(pentapeptide) pyrophosphoryl-undecaprenol N-acetylglucosamine transferase